MPKKKERIWTCQLTARTRGPFNQDRKWLLRYFLHQGTTRFARKCSQSCWPGSDLIKFWRWSRYYAYASSRWDNTTETLLDFSLPWSLLFRYGNVHVHITQRETSSHVVVSAFSTSATRTSNNTRVLTPVLPCDVVMPISLADIWTLKRCRMLLLLQFCTICVKMDYRTPPPNPCD